MDSDDLSSAPSPVTGSDGVLLRLRTGLVELRLAAGLTQAQLADRMGTTQSAVARLEAGTTAVRVDTLERWTHALGRRLRVSVDEPGSVLGDLTGPRIGLSWPDSEPVHLDPAAAAERDLPAVTAVVGRPGCGKGKLMRSLAAQLYAAGRTLVTVAGPDSVSLLPAAVRDVLDAPAGTPAPREITLSRKLPPSPHGPGQFTGTERAALRELADRLEVALADLPDGAVLLAEDAWLLAAASWPRMAALLRSSRSRGVGVVLTARHADDLTAYQNYISRWLLFAPGPQPHDAASALARAGLEATPERIAELQQLDRSDRGGPRLMLLRDVDRRTGLVALGGTTFV